MRRGAVVMCVCLCILALAGCAPSTPDHDEWRSQGDQALSEVASNVATARLLLQQLRADKVHGAYAQTGVLDTETNAGSASSRFTAVQPEPADDDAYQRVTTVLSDAGDLLAQVRIAVVRRDDQAYPGLIRKLSSTLGDLGQEQARLGGGPPR
jgi:hypothetical protein